MEGTKLTLYFHVITYPIINSHVKPFIWQEQEIPLLECHNNLDTDMLYMLLRMIISALSSVRKWTRMFSQYLYPKVWDLSEKWLTGCY